MNVICRNGLLDRIHPEERPQVIAEIAKALDEGFGTHEYRFKCKDGKYHWLADHFSFIKDKTGMTRFRAGIVRNITEQKRVEEALAASEKEYRELFNSMTEMFQVLELVYDENGQAVDFYYREVNPATEKLTGKSRDEMVGKQARELFGVVEEYWIQALDLVNKSGEPLHFENYSKELDKYYDLNAFKVADRANTVAIVFSDITERRKAEEDLKNLNETLEARVQERTTELHEAYILLKESEKSLAESQEIAHIGSWDWDIETNKVRWSDETYHIFGLNPQELEASFGLFFSYVHPDDRESIENEVKEALKEKLIA